MGPTRSAVNEVQEKRVRNKNGPCTHEALIKQFIQMRNV